MIAYSKSGELALLGALTAFTVGCGFGDRQSARESNNLGASCQADTDVDHILDALQVSPRGVLVNALQVLRNSSEPNLRLPGDTERIDALLLRLRGLPSDSKVGSRSLPTFGCIQGTLTEGDAQLLVRSLRYLIGDEKSSLAPPIMFDTSELSDTARFIRAMEMLVDALDNHAKPPASVPVAL